MPAPPRARDGDTGSSVGRTIVPGVGPFLRPLPPRVTPGLLTWSPGLLAEATGKGFCYGRGTELRIADLLPHLVDAYDLYADNTGNLPRLVPIHHATVLFSPANAWIKLDVLKKDLRHRADVGPESLLNAATVFATTFKLVQDGNELTASYEMIHPISFGGAKKNALTDLAASFDAALLTSRRGWHGGQKFIEVSTRQELLSQEALIFLVLHHLSNMVRCRPEEVEKLRQSKYFWLFSSWVDRACENYLLSMASRITREEHVIL